MFDARTWIFGKLQNDGGLAALVGDRIFGSLSATETPDEKPFIVIRMGDIVREMPEGGMVQPAVLWIHGDPFGYTQIDQVVNLCRELLEGPIIATDGIYCSWEADSADLSDDARKTNLRTSSYRLAGRR